MPYLNSRIMEDLQKAYSQAYNGDPTNFGVAKINGISVDKIVMDDASSTREAVFTYDPVTQGISVEFRERRNAGVSAPTMPLPETPFAAIELARMVLNILNHDNQFRSDFLSELSGGNMHIFRTVYDDSSSLFQLDAPGTILNLLDTEGDLSSIIRHCIDAMTQKGIPASEVPSSVSDYYRKLMDRMPVVPVMDSDARYRVVGVVLQDENSPTPVGFVPGRNFVVDDDDTANSAIIDMMSFAAVMKMLTALSGEGDEYEDSKDEV
jgi:hypothetical protein